MRQVELRRLATVTAALLAAFAVMLCAAARVAAVPVSVTVVRGDLSLSELRTGDFGTVVLSGEAERVPAFIGAVRVTDSRGSGEGWRVTAQATRFTAWDPAAGRYADEAEHLPAGSLDLPCFATVRQTPGPPPPAALPGPFTIDRDSPVVVARADSGSRSGMGIVELVPQGPMYLRLDADALAGSYRSEMTVSVVSGP